MCEAQSVTARLYICMYIYICMCIYIYSLWEATSVQFSLPDLCSEIEVYRYLLVRRLCEGASSGLYKRKWFILFNMLIDTIQAKSTCAQRYRLFIKLLSFLISQHVSAYTYAIIRRYFYRLHKMCIRIVKSVTIPPDDGITVCRNMLGN
jgi:hypothetical protein